MINLFISYGITEDNVSSLMIVLWDGVAKKAKKPYFQMRARAYRLHLANVASGELAFYWVE